ncbi:MAG: DUF2339 domain-containing protein [Bryobacterales bacterium]|nr:DUF2339 domain-containing protein [Bryobacterales bacterium]
MNLEEQLRQLNERMEALTEANARLLRRVGDLERQVRALSGEAWQPPVPPAAPPVHAEQPQFEPADLPASVPVEAEAAAEPETRTLESKLGLAWVNRVAVITCIFAAAFFFKYAADNEWIGPSGRVALGLVAGCVSIALAERFHGRGERIYSQGLCGLGVSLLYLSFFAAFHYYALLPQAPVFALMALTIALGGVLALRFRSQAIAGLALVGGLLTPPLLSTGQFNAAFFYAYLLTLVGAAQWLARRESWRALDVGSQAGAVWFVLGSMNQMQRANGEGWFVAFAVAAFALFLGSGVRWAGYVALGLWPVLLYGGEDAGFAPFAAALMMMTAGGLAWGRAKAWEHALPVVYGAVSLSFYLWLLESSSDNALTQNVPLAAVLFLLFLAWIPLRVRDGLALRTVDLAVTAANAFTFFGTVYVSFEERAKGWLGVAAIVTALVHLGAARLARVDARGALLFLGLTLGLATVAVPLQFSAFHIAIAWALEAAALAWVAARMRSAQGAALSLLVGMLAVMDVLFEFHGPRLYFAEGEAIPAALFNTRMLTMAVCAGSLWLMARWLGRWVEMARLAAAPYVTGHLMLAYALTLEVMEWAHRGEAENALSVARLSVTILYAVYGVALISIGVAARSALNRVLGLLAIAFVILKLYLYDVWNLATVYRVIAFGALGGLLLLTSFLYSRYRGKIESLWQGDNR